MRFGRHWLNATPAAKMAVTAMAVAAALTGCGSDSSSAESGDPMSCLKDSGLNDAEDRGGSLWRAYHDTPFYQVTVHEHESADAAKNAFFAATDVYVSYGGRFSVDGPAKPSAGGLVTSAEGDEAQRVVVEVAQCLAPDSTS